ncbi:hypothetical protein QMP26_41200 (plasmid) [Enterocloster clostridioformis]
MRERLLQIIKDKSGGTVVVMAPYMVLMIFLTMVLFINHMVLATKRNQIQIMADSASRAGALAVEKSYAVRERTGYGLGDYHVYNELNEEHAKVLSRMVMEQYEPLLSGITIERVEENPVGFTFPVWNNRKFRYEEKPLSSQKQYKNGNFSLRIQAKLEAAAKGYFGGVMDTVDIDVYSQSTAKGTLVGIH